MWAAHAQLKNYRRWSSYCIFKIITTERTKSQFNGSSVERIHLEPRPHTESQEQFCCSLMLAATKVFIITILTWIPAFESRRYGVLLVDYFLKMKLIGVTSRCFMTGIGLENLHHLLVTRVLPRSLCLHAWDVYLADSRNFFYEFNRMTLHLISVVN